MHKEQVTRVKFDKPRTAFDVQYSKEEKEIITLAETQKSEVDKFFENKTALLLVDLVDRNLSYYKDKLVYESDPEAQKLLRGIIQGQQEIKNIITLIKKARNKNLEDKK